MMDRGVIQSGQRLDTGVVEDDARRRGAYGATHRHIERRIWSDTWNSTRRSDTHLECTSLRAAPVALPPQALPVWSGEKFGANFWIHQYDFRSAHASGCTMG